MIRNDKLNKNDGWADSINTFLPSIFPKLDQSNQQKLVLVPLVTPHFPQNCNYVKTSCIVIYEACNCVYVNENTRQMTGKEALSIGHDTTGGIGEVELGCFNEEIRKLTNIPTHIYIT
jgi:hypothetical protein